MRIDDNIAENEVLLVLFKNINPNTISIIGIISNFIILKYLYEGNIYLANIYLVIRYFADILDGAVARKYNKLSKLGGYLDTTNDILLMSIYVSFLFWKFTNNFKYTKITFTFIALGLILYFKNEDVMYNHDNLKKESDSSLKNLVQFLTNNSILAFITAMYINANYL